MKFYLCYNVLIGIEFGGMSMKWSIPTKTIAEGRKLSDEGRVTKVYPVEAENVWRAEVIDDQKYYVILDGSGKEEDICQCDEWFKKHFCVHTVAVELFLQDHSVVRAMKFSQRPLFYYPADLYDESETCEQVYQEFYQHFIEEETADYFGPLLVEIELYDEQNIPFSQDNDSLFYLRLRLGIDTSYYVNDLEAFFQALVSGESFNLQNHNNDQVCLRQECFDPDMYAFLNSLAEDFLRHKHWENTIAHVPSTKKNQQRLYLNEEELIALLKTDLIKHVFIANQELEDFSLIENDRPILYNIAYDGEIYRLTQLQEAKWYRFYGLIFNGEDFYHIGGDDKYFDAMSIIQDNFVLNRFKLDFKPEEMKNFFSLFGRLLLEHSLVKNVTVLDFAPLLDLDCQLEIGASQGRLELALTFHYGDYMLSDDPIETDLPEDKTLLRQLADELDAEAFLRAYGFTKENYYYCKDYGSIDQMMRDLQRFEQYLPEDWKISYTKNLESWQSNDIEVEVVTEQNKQHRFLTIDFETDDINEHEIDRIIERLQANERFMQLEDGRIINVNQVFTEDQNRMLKQLKQQNKQWKNGDPIPIYQSLLFADLLNSQADFEAFYEDIMHPDQEDYRPNPRLKTELSDYQQYAVQWFKVLAKYQLGGLLADEMGLGKTVQTIAFLLDYLEEHPSGQVLIVAPASVLYNWYHELDRFAPSLEAVVIDGSAEEREQMREEGQGKIWISSYSSYRNDQVAYQDYFFDVLILDEAQALKNNRTVLYQSFMQQKSGLRIALSGTPLENNLQEFWSLMQIILPGLLPARRDYQQLSVDQIRKRVQPFVLRRTKADVSLELPEKRSSDRYAGMTAEQKNIYLAYLKDIQEQLAEGNFDSGRTRMEMLAAITRLRQICCHPRLIDPDSEAGSGKFDYYRNLLDRVLQDDKRVLVFSQFTSMLDILEEDLKAEGVTYFRIDGQTKKGDRQSQVDAFNHGEGSVFLISLRAGGVGINLTGADTVFLYDLWWNPSIEEQAIGRAHRIGQKKNVQVYRMITEGTIEQRIAELQEEKRNLFEQLFDEEAKDSDRLSMEDLKYILDYEEK